MKKKRCCFFHPDPNPLYLCLQRFCTILVFVNYFKADETCSRGKGCVISATNTRRFANHNTPGQLTNQSTFHISEGGASSKQELISAFERRGAAIMSNIWKIMRFWGVLQSCCSTPQKPNQHCVNEHNRAPLTISMMLK